jgi:hypothetical protein
MDLVYEPVGVDSITCAIERRSRHRVFSVKAAWTTSESPTQLPVGHQHACLLARSPDPIDAGSKSLEIKAPLRFHDVC